MPGGGYIKDRHACRAVLRTRAGAVIWGSATFRPRAGNPDPVLYITEDGTSGNLVGLRNFGGEHHRLELPGAVEETHKAQRPFILNVAGEDRDEYVEMAKIGVESGVDGIEINLSCGNVLTQDEVICFNLDLTAEVVGSVLDITPAAVSVLVKISPHSNRFALKTLARLLAEFPIAAVVAGNTFPDGLILDAKGNTVISGRGSAGLGGTTLRYISLGNVAILRDTLPNHIEVIGCGGIATGKHAWEHLQLGAAAIQVHTAARAKDPPHDITPHVFDDIIWQLGQIEQKQKEI